jgi:hypothetical protein
MRYIMPETWKTVTRVHTRLLDREPTDDGYDSRQIRTLTAAAAGSIELLWCID